MSMVGGLSITPNILDPSQYPKNTVLELSHFTFQITEQGARFPIQKYLIANKCNVQSLNSNSPNRISM